MAGKGGKMFGATVKIDGEKLRAMIEDYWPHSRASFARECKIDPSTLSKMLLRGSCNAEMLNRVARGFDMRGSELMDKVAKYKSVPHSYRVKANMSLEELERKSGISIMTISRIEEGGDCFVFTAFCLSQVFGVSVGQYMGYKE